MFRWNSKEGIEWVEGHFPDLFKLPSKGAKLLENDGVYYYKEVKDMSCEELKKFNKEENDNDTLSTNL